MEPERIKVMRFAENNRISHRQLFRQIILVFPAPFLLCLFKNGAMLGISAMAGTAAAAVVLSFLCNLADTSDTCIWGAFQKDRKFYCTIYWPVLFWYM